MTTDFRRILTDCGFRVATAAFAGSGGNPCYHARGIVDGDYLDCSVNSVTHLVTLWGTPDVLTLDEFAERFRVEQAAPSLPWLDRVKLAGFRNVKWSTDAIGERYGLRHYRATDDQGRDWLILAESESLVCYSDRPWSDWKLADSGDLVRDSVDNTSKRRDISPPPPPPPREALPASAALAAPVEYSGATHQTALF